MFGETTIFYVKIWNHPIETTIYKWLFGVPGNAFLMILMTGNLVWLFGNSKEAPAGAVLRAAFWMCTKIGTALRRYMAEGQGATAFEAQEDVAVSWFQSC